MIVRDGVPFANSKNGKFPVFSASHFMCNHVILRNVTKGFDCIFKLMWIAGLYEILCLCCVDLCSADSRLAPSQWERSLQSNTVSHSLGANLEWSLFMFVDTVLFLNNTIFHKILSIVTLYFGHEGEIWCDFCHCIYRHRALSVTRWCWTMFNVN